MLKRLPAATLGFIKECRWFVAIVAVIALTIVIARVFDFLGWTTAKNIYLSVVFGLFALGLLHVLWVEVIVPGFAGLAYTLKTPSELRRIRDNVVHPIGFLCRWAFVAGVGLVFYFVFFESYQHVFDTPFAQVTLGGLLMAMTLRLFGVLFILGLLRWAFNSGEKPYKGWASFGAIVFVAAAVLL